MITRLGNQGANLCKLKQTEDFQTVRWNSAASLILAYTAKTTDLGADFRSISYSKNPVELKLKPYNSHATATIKIEHDDSFDKWDPGTRQAFVNLGNCSTQAIIDLLNEINTARVGLELPKLENLENLPKGFTGKKVTISSETTEGKPFHFIYSLSENNGEIIVEENKIGLKFRTLELHDEDSGYEDLRRFGLMGLATLLPSTLARFAIPFSDDKNLIAKYGPAIES